MSNLSYFPALTGVRALAAYAVCFHHYNCFRHSVTFLNTELIGELHIGVSVFFVLSGFLITLRYYDTTQLTKKWFFPYFRNRFARIFPMYFLLTTATFAVMIYQNADSQAIDEWFWQYFVNISFTKAFFGKWAFTGIQQGWSLTVEECFYFSAPLIFIFSKRFSVFFLVVPLVGMGFLVAQIGTGIGLLGDTMFILYSTFFGRCMEFLVGVQLAFWVQKVEKNKIKPVFFPKIPVFTLFSLFYIGACLWWLVSFRIDGRGFGVRTLEGILLNNFVLPWGIAAFFWGLIYEKTWLRSLLETPLFQLLGKASFIFYLIHFGFIRDYLETVFNRIYHSCFYLFIILNLLSILLFWAIEQPVHNWLRKK